MGAEKSCAESIDYTLKAKSPQNLFTKSFPEFINPTRSINNSLLASIERMAGRTHLDMQILT
jgi:hypothetical protein